MKIVMQQSPILAILCLLSIVAALDINIYLLGRTGDGKSATGDSLVRVLGNRVNFDEFGESDGGSSHTHAPKSIRVDWNNQKIVITDTPGLMDTRGLAQDEKNIRQIVDHARAQGVVHGFVLIMNEQAPRLDAAMQDAMKLLVDSFGPQIINNFGIIFTRSTSRSKEDSIRWVAEHAKPLLEKRLGFAIRHIPSWQVDNHPESLAALGVPHDRIEDMKAKSSVALQEMTRWVTTLNGVSTADAKYGEYEAQQRIREETRKKEEAEQEKHKAQAAAVEAERLKREAEARAEQARRERDDANARAAAGGGGGNPSLGDQLLGREGNKIFKKIKKLF